MTTQVSCITCGVEIRLAPGEQGDRWRCGKCSRWPLPRPVVASPLSGIDLAGRHFCYQDALRDLINLIDSGHCTPECLFAVSDPDTCTCRCNGGCHGDARRDAEVVDP